MTAKRPRHMPRAITVHWEGASYPDKHGVNFRVTVNGERFAKYFAYGRFKDDALAAHKAGAKWRMAKLATKKFKLTSRAPTLRKKRRRADGVTEFALVYNAQAPDGTPIKKTFYIGTENTATKQRRERAQLRAEMWIGQYRRWFEDGGRHPMEAR